VKISIEIDCTSHEHSTRESPSRRYFLYQLLQCLEGPDVKSTLFAIAP
jgi:hypothetical protein